MEVDRPLVLALTILVVCLIVLVVFQGIWHTLADVALIATMCGIAVVAVDFGLKRMMR